MQALQFLGTKVSNKKKISVFNRKKTLALSLLALPGLLLLLVFNYLPIFGLALAFKDYRYDLGFFGSKWVGLKNFYFFFTSQDALKITKNTLDFFIWSQWIRVFYIL